MRRSTMIASSPWTLLITLEENLDTLGCRVLFQEMNGEGLTVDQWDRLYARVEEALLDLEGSYGVEPDQWVDLG